MSVNELSQEQLEELREHYFAQLQDAGEEEGITEAQEIPMTDVIAHYEGIYFVNDDFFCTMDQD